jgi:cytochrome P450
MRHLVAGTAQALAERFPSATRPLVDPPPGSGLKPVLGDPGPPVVGHTLSVLNDTVAFTRRWHERYGDVSWMNAFGTQMVMAIGPDAIEQVLTNRGRTFSSEQGWGTFLVPFFERGVMLMDFEEHRTHRRIMQGAFKRERLVEYLADMGPTIAAGVASWKPATDVHLFDHAKQLTFESRHGSSSAPSQARRPTR